MRDRNDRYSRDEGIDRSDEMGRRWHDDTAYERVRHEAREAIRKAGSGGRPRQSASSTVRKSFPKPLLIAAAIVLGIAIFALAAYLVASHNTSPSSAPPTNSQKLPAATATAPAPASTQPSQPATSSGPSAASSDSPIPGLPSAPTSTTTQEDEGVVALAARVTLRLALAALLTSLLAFRPRKDLPIMQRNPYVAQTQILLAVVASALMMIVADNAARAFGIFAAASLIRFRTNIHDPKEITVLLISLGIGLASGVGKIEVAILLALFVLVMLWVLEYYEPTQVFRALELTVTTRKVDMTDEALREIFDRHRLTTELRITDREDENDPLGKIVYYVNVNPRVSTDSLSEEIFASDPENIDAVSWDQKKSQSYIYR